jgi:GH25 family lysozyme M1 (1,4-beta-N-acetylmuramidase)
VEIQMTIFGTDLSHYDGALNRAFFVRAAAEGIAFVTHKLGEGLGGEDVTQGTALAAARDAGIQILGGYWFLHGNLDPAAEARACVARADADEPWWRDFPGWVWQADAETSSTGLPTRAHVKAFADELASATGRVVLVYASHGMYGDSLTGLGHRLWNANYPTGRQAPFRDLYPGDSYAGWDPYSGQTPVIAQYSSAATIAGHTTCDVNAYRGTVEDLLTLIGADMAAVPTADEIADAILAKVVDQPGVTSSVANLLAVTYLNTSAAKMSLGNLTPAAIGAAVKAALPPSIATGLNAEQVGAAVHAQLVAVAQAEAAALAAQK